MDDELTKRYFEWMLQLVNHEAKYRRLLRHLFGLDFVSIMTMDKNRGQDGISLRYRFGRLYGYDSETIEEVLDYRPCSVLEMMVALADRCETHLLWNPDLGDRTDIWFWTMIRNLGLSDMTDDHYDALFVEEVVNRLISRRYKPNGEGGLFTTSDPSIDMRKLEIWAQMSTYVKSIM